MKNKRKLGSSNSPKAKAAQLQREWEALLARHSKPLERGAQSFGLKAVKVAPIKKEPATPRLLQRTTSSNPNSMMGIAAKAPTKVYTGDKMIGIAVLHKSNSVPIFSQEDAIDVAKMRR